MRHAALWALPFCSCALRQAGTCQPFMAMHSHLSFSTPRSLPPTHRCSLTQLPVSQQPLHGGPHNFSHPSPHAPLSPFPPQHPPPSPQLLPLLSALTSQPEKPLRAAGGRQSSPAPAVAARGDGDTRTLPPAPQPAPLGEHQQLELTIWQHVFLLQLVPRARCGSVFRRSPQKRTAQAPT